MLETKVAIAIACENQEIRSSIEKSIQDALLSPYIEPD